jgi:hypothetical protein
VDIHAMDERTRPEESAREGAALFRLPSWGSGMLFQLAVDLFFHLANVLLRLNIPVEKVAVLLGRPRPSHLAIPFVAPHLSPLHG